MCPATLTFFNVLNMNDFNLINCAISLQKEPQRRSSAGDLLNHPFIQRYNEADADLIFWLKEY